jgi:hypothetical protein
MSVSSSRAREVRRARTSRRDRRRGMGNSGSSRRGSPGSLGTVSSRAFGGILFSPVTVRRAEDKPRLVILADVSAVGARRRAVHPAPRARLQSLFRPGPRHRVRGRPRRDHRPVRGPPRRAGTGPGLSAALCSVHRYRGADPAGIVQAYGGPVALSVVGAMAAWWGRVRPLQRPRRRGPAFPAARLAASPMVS